MTTEKDGWQFVVEIIHLYRDVMRINEQATGMSQTRLEIMHDLNHADEISQAELQKRLGVEGAVITRIVKQMEVEGLVTRRADPRDNRYTLVMLTPYARSLNTAMEAIKFKETFGAQVIEGLDEAERACLLQGLRHMQENIKTFRYPGPGDPK
jgi:DNA-binding MarR family transcriptional regulator